MHTIMILVDAYAGMEALHGASGQELWVACPVCKADVGAPCSGRPTVRYCDGSLVHAARGDRMSRIFNWGWSGIHLSDMFRYGDPPSTAFKYIAGSGMYRLCERVASRPGARRPLGHATSAWETVASAVRQLSRHTPGDWQRIDEAWRAAFWAFAREEREVAA